jgi:hypothetical protein
MLIPIDIVLALAVFAFGFGALFGASIRSGRRRPRSYDFTPSFSRRRLDTFTDGGWRPDAERGYR